MVLGEAGMIAKSKKEYRRRRKRRATRPYLIDIEDFETVEDIEMDDWMFGSSSGNMLS